MKTETNGIYWMDISMDILRLIITLLVVAFTIESFSKTICEWGKLGINLSIEDFTMA